MLLLFKSCNITITFKKTIKSLLQDGQTYIVNQEKQSVRFQFDQSVSAFTAGYYSLNSDSPSLPALAYATFHNKIYIYYNISLPKISLETMTELLKCTFEVNHENFEKYQSYPELQELVTKTLYGI